MATITTYLLVSGEEPDVQEHSIIQEYDLELRERTEGDRDQAPSLRFAVQRSLEDAEDLEEPFRLLSEDIPGASVVMCEVEERFGQIERVRTVVFRAGKRAGKAEHGHVFNVEGG